MIASHSNDQLLNCILKSRGNYSIGAHTEVPGGAEHPQSILN